MYFFNFFLFILFIFTFYATTPVHTPAHARAHTRTHRLDPPLWNIVPNKLSLTHTHHNTRTRPANSTATALQGGKKSSKEREILPKSVHSSPQQRTPRRAGNLLRRHGDSKLPYSFRLAPLPPTHPHASPPSLPPRARGRPTAPPPPPLPRRRRCCHLLR